MVKKCLFPVAGYGTRFLPATKAMPKEILPIVDKPLVQYGVEEAVEAGLTDIGFVTGRTKRAIEDHFDVSFELEHQIAGTGREKQLEGIRALIEHCTFSYTRQITMQGLGHAIMTGRTLIGDEPFGVVFADDLCFGEGTGVLAQMTKLFRQFRCSIVAIKVPPTRRTGTASSPAKHCRIRCFASPIWLKSRHLKRRRATWPSSVVTCLPPTSSTSWSRPSRARTTRFRLPMHCCGRRKMAA